VKVEIEPSSSFENPPAETDQRFQAAVKVWLEAGAEGVVITGRRKNVLDETAAAFGAAKSKVLTVAADISRDVDTDKMYKETIARFGRLPDVVLANAGWVSPALPPAEEKAATWWSVYVRGLPSLPFRVLLLPISTHRKISHFY
jgi:NAD(P)-dependent dehydrogenase (short-subunit alcohol dehydrogenase family)